MLKTKQFKLRKYLLLVFICFSLNANANFDFNANCIKAYKEIFGLRLNAARILIDSEKKRNPQNAVPYLLDNYVDYFDILTTESKSAFDRLKNNRSPRIDRIANDDKNSPYYLFAQAEVHLQWSLVHGLFQEYFTSSVELNKAYRLLQDNAKKFPAFLPNQKDMGIINAVLGSLPESIKRTISVIGLKGNSQNGVKMLENLLVALPQSPYAFFYDDVVSCLAYVQTDILNDYTTYSKIVANSQKIDSSSLLRTYIISYSAMRTAHTNEGIAELNNRPTGREYQPYPYLDYLNGVLRMRKLDFTAAKYFQSYIQNNKGINYSKDAYLNLAWISLLKGSISGYNDNIALLKAKGYTFHEKDKQALTEANDPPPDTDLLKARLLFDGGFYDKALAEIKDKRTTDFKNSRDKIEFCYRLGRIYDETEKDEMAIKFYQVAIDMGKKERYYFASNAALRIGNIYEKKKNYAQARLFYNMVLDMKDHDYERSIESKAKDGLRRTGG